MDKSLKIKSLMRGITGTDRQKFDFLLMEVVSVDGDVCSAKIGEFVIPDIRLASIPGGADNGILITPAIGSIIIVADLSCGELRDLAALGYSEIESLLIHKGDTVIAANDSQIMAKVGGSSIHMTKDKIVINGGDNAGLAKVVGLVSRFEKIEEDINHLKDLFASWSPVNAIETDTKALKAILGSWVGHTLEVTTQADIENTKVTH